MASYPWMHVYFLSDFASPPLQGGIYLALLNLG
jgi:hypothetical protein